MNKTWKKIFGIVLRNKAVVRTLLFWILILGLFDATYPLVNKYVMDKYFVENSIYPNLILVVSYYFISAVFYCLGIRGFMKNTVKVEAFVSYELREEAFKNIQKLSYSYYDITPQGKLMSIMTSDSRRLANILSWGMLDFFIGFIQMIGIISIMFIIEWRLALIFIALIPILYGICLFFNKKILKKYRKTREINAQITSLLNEELMGGKTSKTLVIEDQNYLEFSNEVFHYKKAFMRSVIISSLLVPIVFLIMYIGVGITLYTGSAMAISIGTLYVFIDCTVRFFDPVNQMTRVMADFQNAQAAAERVISLIETKPQIVDTLDVIEKYGDEFNPKKENWEEIKGDIEFKNVSFQYNEGKPVLNDFNLTIKAGSSVAIVGRTGGGKTTIVNLLCRFYEPVEGSILIDGKDYRERSIAWLHSNLGYVLQTPQLFSGTIMDNIRYGHLEATDEEVIAAAKLVNADEFIRKMSEGYNTIIKEGGNNLSLGEKQLISFARAIISNPKILVLDEATSSIDTITETNIKEAIMRVMKGRTTFAIAHRLSTIINSDLILVVNDGKIVERGTHKELLHKFGYYYELYKNQFIKEVDEQTR